MHKLFTEVPGHRLYTLHWPQDKPPLLLLHGFLDQSHSFENLAQMLSPHFDIWAYDARGFGRSSWNPPGFSYHFWDYLQDLKAFIQSRGWTKLHLLGHSMGGMIGSFYSALYPEQIVHFINLEGWCVPHKAFKAAPEQTQKWLEFKSSSPSFSNPDYALKRLLKHDALLSEKQAQTMLEHFIIQENKTYRWRYDPRHRSPSARPFYLEQACAYWQGITSPTLLLSGEHSFASHFAKRKHYFPNAQSREIPQAGHNLHWHQPRAISEAILSFISS